MYHIIVLPTNTYSISREAKKGLYPVKLPAFIAWFIACKLNSK